MTRSGSAPQLSEPESSLCISPASHLQERPLQVQQLAGELQNGDSSGTEPAVDVPVDLASPSAFRPIAARQDSQFQEDEQQQSSFPSAAADARGQRQQATVHAIQKLVAGLEVSAVAQRAMSTVVPRREGPRTSPLGTACNVLRPSAPVEFGGQDHGASPSLLRAQAILAKAKPRSRSTSVSASASSRPGSTGVHDDLDSDQDQDLVRQRVLTTQEPSKEQRLGRSTVDAKLWGHKTGVGQESNATLRRSASHDTFEVDMCLCKYVHMHAYWHCMLFFAVRQHASARTVLPAQAADKFGTCCQ